MKSLLITGLIFFFGVTHLYGQAIFSLTGLEIGNHKEVYVLVEDLSQSALDIGLTESKIKSRVNVRLRQVGLRPVDQRAGYLYINISVVGAAFSTNLSFYRVVNFKVEGVEYLAQAIIYRQVTTGTHGRDSEYIISSLDRLLDQFLSDYLDAND